MQDAHLNAQGSALQYLTFSLGEEVFA
ncbi:MAG: hypothetical protein RLZ51_505, partial [Pseudomonadota bacterium]